VLYSLTSKEIKVRRSFVITRIETLIMRPTLLLKVFVTWYFGTWEIFVAPCCVGVEGPRCHTQGGATGEQMGRLIEWIE
jgi:hypothetical protein